MFKTISFAFCSVSVLGPVRIATREDQHLDPGVVAAANNRDDPAGLVGVGRRGLARFDGGHAMPGHLGGVGRRPNGQPAHRFGER